MQTQWEVGRNREGQGAGPGGPLTPSELAALVHTVLSEFAKSRTPVALQAHAAFVLPQLLP